MIRMSCSGFAAARRSRRALAVSCGLLLCGGLLSAIPVLGASATPSRGALATAEGEGFQVQGAGASFDTSLPPASEATYVWTPGGQSVQEWLTSANGSALEQRMSPQAPIPLTGGGARTLQIQVDPGQRHQQMVGFGVAMTDSAASLIYSSPHRNDIMDALFGSDGARLNFVRVPMGASDMVANGYHQSYDDSATADPTLSKFTIGHDTSYIIPLLKQAAGLSPRMKLLGTPWSAPAWMKTGDTFYGDCSPGRNDLIGVDTPIYAQYFVKFVQAYRSYGLPVSYVSLQNEPENCDSSYPTMNMTPQDEIRLAQALRPALNSAGFTQTGILGWDHNWYDQGAKPGAQPSSYPSTVLTGAGSSLAAIGYHCYNTDNNYNAPATQVQPTSATAVFMTECSGNYGANNAAANLTWEVHYALLGPIRNGASASLYWNLALGTDGQPHTGGCSNCRGMIAIDKSTGNFSPSQDYYYWEQFSRFVDPGAVRIGSTQSGSIQTVAFQNPGGSIVLVALNTGYNGYIVQRSGDTKTQKTAWLVGPDGHRRWISDIATYNCLKNNSAPGPVPLDSSQLNQLPDLTGVWAVCGADRIGVNSMLQQGFYARSQNGTYTLSLTGSNLTLAEPGNRAVWSTGHGGDDLILQADGNLVEYSGGTPVWASNTVGSGAAWLVVRNDGKLGLYNTAGNLVWTSEGSPAQYTGHIVQWDGDTKAQKTAWLVGPDGHRRWISDIATYNCLKNNGAAGPDVLTSWELNQMPDLTNVWAVCGADRIGVNSMLQQGFYARSQNGTYTLRLTGSNLTLTDTSGTVIWSTGHSGDDLILQADGNLVEYSGGTAVWASNTVGSGAAWLVVNNDGTLDLYNGAGSKVWSSVGNPSSYIGHIVEWVNGGGKPNTSWIVSSDGKRYWIPDTSTYSCMVNIGFSDLGPQPPGVLNSLPDSGQWAHCPVNPRGAQDTLSAGQGLYQGQAITSLNGQYNLILQQDHNLVLYGPSGALWATNTWTGGFVIMQSDGNFVGYDMWDAPKWSTGTGGDGSNCDMVVQNDANLVLYCGGVAKWDRYHGRL